MLVTKYRRKVLTQEIIDHITSVTLKLFTNWGITIINIGGEKDHVHIEFKAHPSIELARVVANLKTVTSRSVRSNHRESLGSVLKKGLWSRAYYIKSIGTVSEDTVRVYIEKHKF